MRREYFVRPGFGNWWVLTGVRNEKGELIKIDIIDTFQTKEEADDKASLGNYIVLKGRELHKKFLQV